MVSSLHLLTDALLRTLGRASAQDYLRQMLRDCDMDASVLLRAGGERPYPVVWTEHGLTLQVQPFALPSAAAVPGSDTSPEAEQAAAAQTDEWTALLAKHLGPAEPTKDEAPAVAEPQDPNAPPEGYSWGLHSVTFEAARWRGPWPGNLTPQSATPGQWIEALPGDAQTRTEILRTPEMACLSLPGADGQTWSAVLLFDSAAKLQSLTFARAGDWIAASTLPPWLEVNLRQS